MRLPVIAIALSLLSGEISTGPRPTASLTSRWAATSRLGPTDAAAVLAREADGRPVSPAELFEARKYLRTDGPISMAAHVLGESFRKRLAGLLGTSPPSASLPPPLLHWLESRATPGGIELRGESVQVALIETTSGRAVAVLEHATIHELWGLCEDRPCNTQIDEPIRTSDVSYGLALPRRSRASCEPAPSGAAASSGERPRIELHHAGDRFVPGAARRIVCQIALPRDGSSCEWSYSLAGRLAKPPATAISSIAHNPLEIGFDHGVAGDAGALSRWDPFDEQETLP